MILLTVSSTSQTIIHYLFSQSLVKKRWIPNSYSLPYNGCPIKTYSEPLKTFSGHISAKSQMFLNKTVHTTASVTYRWAGAVMQFI